LRNNNRNFCDLEGENKMPVVACSNCGTKNRVDPRNAAQQIARCGKCQTPLDVSKAEEAAPQTQPLIVTDSTFQREVLDSNSVPVLLDCWAPWCGPCRMVGPIMDQLAAESNGRYRIAKLNVDENPRTAAQFQIQSIPTMLIFKNGRLVDRLVGAQPKPAIMSRLMAHTT
jgi:thioredoxin